VGGRGKRRRQTLPGFGNERTHQDVLGPVMGEITGAVLGEAPCRAQRLPAGGAITGSSEAGRVYKGFTSRMGWP
jgi:hypothetical protein